MIDGGHETFEHDADVGVRGCGPTLEVAFQEAAAAISSIVTELEQIAARDCVEIECEADDDELLLVAWLNALVFEMATRGMLFGRFAVEIDGGRLRGRAWGECVDRARHEPAVEVKGATMTELRVWREPSGRWCAQCVVDV
jgi:tRNA nucleotidyltransferase (CCA-adding enzyme)